MKKILIVFAAAITIASCKEAEKKTDTTAANAAPTTSEAANTATATSTATATQQNQATVDPASLTTIQWLDGADKDFGKMKEGETLNVSFRFKNTGTKPLVISNVTAGCGCTVPETPKKPYQPGETGEIKASFNSSGKVGSQSKQVNVFANVEPAMTTLVFRVEVKAKS
jgi:hypothetical protein